MAVGVCFHDRQCNRRVEVPSLQRMSCLVHYKNFIWVNNSSSTKIIFRERRKEILWIQIARPELPWMTLSPFSLTNLSHNRKLL
jgi:hypothetical protein